MDDRRAQTEVGSKLLSAAPPSEVDEYIALIRDQRQHLPSLPPLNPNHIHSQRVTLTLQALSHPVHFPLIN